MTHLRLGRSSRRIALLAGLLLGGFAASPAHALQVDDPLPGFSLPGLDGSTYTHDQFRGRVLVLYFLGYA